LSTAFRKTIGTLLVLYGPCSCPNMEASLLAAPAPSR